MMKDRGGGGEARSERSGEKGEASLTAGGVPGDDGLGALQVFITLSDECCAPANTGPLQQPLVITLNK